MGGIAKRIESLEQRIRPLEETAAEADRRQFLWRALDAMAHVKRSSIDPEQWRYSVEKLRQQSPQPWRPTSVFCAIRSMKTKPGHARFSSSGRKMSA